MAAFNYDARKMRIVRYDGDPACLRYMMPQEKNCSLTTPRGNVSGSGYRVKLGFGIKIGREQEGHGYMRYIVEVILTMFGFNYYVVVSTGDVYIECDGLIHEQCEALRVFIKIYASYNERQRDAGYTPEAITYSK